MPEKQSWLRLVVLSLFALAFALAFSSPKLHAEDAAGDNFVYVMTNRNPDNSVIQFRRANDGSLTWVREVRTGGSGTGATGVDPLGSQDSLVLSGDGHFLLAVNAGSNELSIFEVKNDQLMLRETIRSGGDFPNSIALSGDLVYVLNAKGATPHINGFRLESNGSLQAISEAEIALPQGSTGANDIRFTDDGTRLLMTVSATNQILVFEVGDNGIAHPPSSQVSAGASPFGIRLGRNGIVIVSEAAGSASSYSFNAMDMLQAITGAVTDTQIASCWITLNRSATYAYVSNTGSGTLSSYQISGNGDLTLTKAIAANPGGAPIDSALSRDSKFLYVLDSALGRVVIFGVDGGNLIPLGAVPSLGTSIQGIAAQ
jgi:6-phosphogluconolactonase